jgi:hypothetical protein
MRAFSSGSHVWPTRTRQTGRVRAFWKVLLGLLLTLPVAAYVAGTLVASQADTPTERTPIVVTGDPSGGVGSLAGSPASDPTRDDRDDPDDDDDWEDVEEVVPEPDDLDDRDDRHEGSDDHGDDDD